MTMLTDQFDVVIGVDTHQDTHTAAIVDIKTTGVLAETTVTCDAAGYDQLINFAQPHAARVWAIEGTGSYGTGLVTRLHQLGETVVEAERPNRPARRGGKNDTIDAVRCAREAIGTVHHAQPRQRGQRAALAAVLVARRSAVQASGDAQRQLRALVMVAPEDLRARFRGQSSTVMVTTASKLRTRPDADIELATSIEVLRSLTRRIAALDTEADRHEAALRSIITAWRPDLLAVKGVGPIVAATVLCAWSHPGRCRNDGAFANLAGVAPLDASSGKNIGRRLNRGGDRQLNRALHTIALCRLRHDPTTRAYVERRRLEPDMTDRKIRRCLKRYIARELYRLLESPPTPT